jgi:hypothetical protein
VNAPRAELGLSNGIDREWLGLGRSRIFEWDGKQLSTNAVVNAVRDASKAPLAQSEGGYPFSRTSHGGIASLELNAPLLIIFIGIFAAAVGPVNLFWFAAGANRHRLFWTTPLISVGASILLAIIIIVNDGTGGVGGRIAFVHLVPQDKKAVLFQEQMTRTGVLFSRRFSVGEDVILTPLTLNGRGAPARSGTLEAQGRTFTGDWFASRSVQAHLAQAIIPTRAEIQLLNRQEISDTVPPVILSSIAVPLRELVYIDQERRTWIGENVQTGQRSTLRKAPDAKSGATGVFRTVELEIGPVIDAAREESAGRAGYFYAFAEQGPYVETLPSIRWRKQHTIYTGPVTSPTP